MGGDSGEEFKWSLRLNYGVNYRLNYGRRSGLEFTFLILWILIFLL